MLITLFNFVFQQLEMMVTTKLPEKEKDEERNLNGTTEKEQLDKKILMNEHDRQSHDSLF